MSISFTKTVQGLVDESHAVIVHTAVDRLHGVVLAPLTLAEHSDTGRLVLGHCFLGCLDSLAVEGLDSGHDFRQF